MPELSPYRGVFRWAWHKAKEYRARFWVAAVAFSLAVAGFGVWIALPPTATTKEKILATVAGIAGAAVIVTGGSYAGALAAAPYQQRNALRAELTDTRAVVAALEMTPVTQEHGDRLREVARRLRQSVRQSDKKLDYGGEPATWRLAFWEHFPVLGDTLAQIDAIDAANQDFLTWLDHELPFLMAVARAGLTKRLQRDPIDGWVKDPDRLNWDWAVSHGAYSIVAKSADRRYERPFQIFLDSRPDPEQLKRRFEQFIVSVAEQPRVQELRANWNLRKELCAQAEPMLTAVANADPITTRCFLCRGALASGTDTAIAPD